MYNENNLLKNPGVLLVLFLFLSGCEGRRALLELNGCNLANVENFFNEYPDANVNESITIDGTSAPALFWAIERRCYSGSGDNVVTYLVEEREADVMHYHLGRNYLYYASSNGDLDLAQYLVEQIPEDSLDDIVNATYAETTALTEAVDSGNSTLVLFLLSQGADPNVDHTSPYGLRTSLLRSIVKSRLTAYGENRRIESYSTLQMVQHLIGYGADVDDIQYEESARQEMNLIDLAILAQDQGLIQLLSDNGATATGMSVAEPEPPVAVEAPEPADDPEPPVAVEAPELAADPEPPVVVEALEPAADPEPPVAVEAPEPADDPEPSVAVEAPEPADDPEPPVAVEAPEPAADPEPPAAASPEQRMFEAFYAQSMDGVRDAVNSGADVDAKDPQGGGALIHYAVLYNIPPLLDMLISLGANVDLAEDTAEMTPLYIASGFPTDAMARTLLAAEADPTRKIDRTRTYPPPCGGDQRAPRNRPNPARRRGGTGLRRVVLGADSPVLCGPGEPGSRGGRAGAKRGGSGFPRRGVRRLQERRPGGPTPGRS